MSTKEIIQTILGREDVSASSFAKIIGITPTQIYDLQSGKIKKISAGIGNKIIAKYPQYNLSYLLTGEGEMLNRRTLEVSTENTVKDKSRLIPFYDAETTGGYEGLVSSSSESAHLIGYIQPGGWFDGRETAAIRHVGNSMREYPDGCVLAVREVTERRLLVPGRNYVVETSEYRVTKRVQRGSEPGLIALYSTNQEKYEDGRLVYEPFEVALGDIRRIFSVLGYIVNQSGEYRLIKP